MNDQWHDPEFIERWDERMRTGHPYRSEQVDIVLAAVASSVAPAGHVLDLGVGTGLVAEKLLRRWPGLALTGIDTSAAALAIARKRLQPLSGGMRLITGDMVEDMPEGTFDAVIAVQTLHHIPHETKVRALRKVRSRLSPGGIVVIAERLVLDTRHFGDVFDALREATSGGERSPSGDLHPVGASHPHDDALGLSDWLAWLAKGGFHATCLDLHLDHVVFAARLKLPAGGRP